MTPGGLVIPALLLLAVGTFALKAVGPLLAAGRELPPLAGRITALLPAALLAALVATQTLGGASGLTLDARILGLGAGALAVACRAPFGIVVLVAAGVTAGVRLVGWG